jgi:peptidoglycan/LPS O-acetylase OafA/YrhL
VLIALAAVFVLAFASYEYVELPLIRFAKGPFAAKPTPSRADLEPASGDPVSLST